jgi:glucan biosynthesis protein C
MVDRRLHWLDWLKVLVVLGVFYYHSAMLFAYAPWLLSNPQKSIALSVFAGWGYTFGMPLLFFLSGAGAWFALRSNPARRFVILRFERLIIPMLAGLVLLSPVQAWYSIAAKGGQTMDLPRYYIAFLASVHFWFNPRWFGFYGYHLWFLGFLFIYSVLALPVMLWLRAGGRRIAEGSGWLSAQPGGITLFALPLALVQGVLRPRYPWYQDWADFSYWLLFFAYGYLFLCDKRFLAGIRRRGPWALLGIALCALAIMPATVTGQVMRWEADPTYSAGALGYLLVRCLMAWLWILFLVWFGMRCLDHGSRVLDYAEEAVLPFYVLHHPVIVVIGFYVIGTSAGMWTKHIVITAAAFAVTVGLYEVGIRRWSPVRRLFGLKPRRRPADASGEAPRSLRPVLGRR